MGRDIEMERGRDERNNVWNRDVEKRLVEKKPKRDREEVARVKSLDLSTKGLLMEEDTRAKVQKRKE
jgi:hypothetical protein